MYNQVEICSPFMPYGSTWTISIQVGGHGVSMMLAVILDCAINGLILAGGNTGLHYKWTSTRQISNCALANCCTAITVELKKRESGT